MVVRVRENSSLRTPNVKLRPPAHSGRIVSRPRLTGALSAGFAGDTRAFVMVSAPAGYGKTCLLTQWFHELSAAGTLTAWCTLDADDTDPLVLWTTITNALRLAASGTDDSLAAEFEALRPASSHQQHSHFLARLAEVVERYDRPIAVLVDDTHVLA